MLDELKPFADMMTIEPIASQSKQMAFDELVTSINEKALQRWNPKMSDKDYIDIYADRNFWPADARDFLKAKTLAESMIDSIFSIFVYGFLKSVPLSYYDYNLSRAIVFSNLDKIKDARTLEKARCGMITENLVRKILRTQDDYIGRKGEKLGLVLYHYEQYKQALRQLSRLFFNKN